MARPLRIDQAGAIYHVLSRGIERSEIFSGKASREDFLKRLAELPSRFAVVVHGYVLMDNHYHLLLRPQGLNLSQAVQWLNVGYSVWYNLKHQRVGPLLQGRFKSALIGEEAQLSEITRYLHLNPVRIRKFGLDTRSRKAKEKGVGTPLDGATIRSAIRHLNAYSWSSYRSYIGLEKAPDWLNTYLVNGLGRKGYRHYVEQGIRMGMPANPWEEAVVEGYLGGREKLEELKKKLKGNRREQKGLRQLEGMVAWEDIVEAVEKDEGRKWQELCGLYGNSGRDLALLLGRRHSGLSLKELGEKVGGVEYPAISEAVRRLVKRLNKDRMMREQYERIVKILNIET
jgi:REP element-mobilizing transposase RayT